MGRPPIHIQATDAEIGEKREAIIAVTIPEHRGSFRRFYRTLGKRSVSEFNYRYANDREAHIFVGVQIRHGVGHFLVVARYVRIGNGALVFVAHQLIDRLFRAADPEHTNEGSYAARNLSTDSERRGRILPRGARDLGVKKFCRPVKH